MKGVRVARVKNGGLLALAAIVVTGLLAVVISAIGAPQPARAACGASSSSCKTCHEINREQPVNQKGDWHTAHAMGDYCSFCHGGNVQATDKAGAHEGLADPFADAKLSCSSCHQDDYQKKAEGYAAALGVTIGSGASGGDSGTGGSSGGEPAAGGNAPTGGAAVSPASASGPVLDFNEYYVDYRGTGGMSTRNKALVVALALLLLGFPAIWAHYKFRDPFLNWVRRPRRTAEKRTLHLAEQLRHLDERTREHLLALLADRDTATKILAALGTLDPELLSTQPQTDSERMRLSLSVAQAVNTAMGGTS